MKLPKYKESSKKGEDGITILKRLVEKELNWLFRPNHKEHDFGIDAYIDIINDFGQVTGKTIAVQVKTGLSYFNENSEFGWIYRGEMSHLNYYLNQDIPVIIILVNDVNNKIYWCYCDPTKTEKTEKKWKITIPFNKELKSESKSELLKYVSPIRDYVSQLEHFWNLNKKFKESERIIFVVDRPDIEQKTYKELLEGIERLQVNPELIHHIKEKVDIWIHGYNEDPRELRDIPEVREWIGLVFEGINGWAYFLAKDENAQFLRLMQFCKMNFKIIDKSKYCKSGIKMHKVEIDLVSGVPFLNELFYDLNLFTDKYNIPIEVNKEVSGNLAEYLAGERPPGF